MIKKSPSRQTRKKTAGAPSLMEMFHFIIACFIGNGSKKAAQRKNKTFGRLFAL